MFRSKIFISTLFLFIFSSCTSQKIDRENKEFLKQYGTEVDKINKKRTELAKERSLEYYMESKDNFAASPGDSGPSERRVSDDMFFIRYNMVNYPDAYMKAPLSFDDIAIPKRDYYGVDSGLGDKSYILLDNRVLQRNVDYVGLSNTVDNREIRTTLVKEQKELDRKIKLKKDLGDEGSDNKSSYNKNNDKPDLKSEK